MELFSKTVQAEDIRAMGEFHQNEDTFSVYFDELERYFTEKGQQQHTRGLSNAREMSRLCFKI